MRRFAFSTLVIGWSAALVVIGAAAQVPQPAAATASVEFFETKIRPVLASNCFDCHGTAPAPSAGLRLDSREAMLKGGRTGAALVPGDPDNSLLIQAVRQSGALKMPKGGKVTPAEIDALAAWVKDGAPWSAITQSITQSITRSSDYQITQSQRAFWSIVPIKKPAAPSVKDASWPRTDIDRFVLARLEKDGLAPVKPADRATLLRRASLDLTGLPPTPEEIDAFDKDTAPGAFAKVVDRLLASPRYGEAWGRMWLDVARYGEDDYRSLDPKGRGFNPYPNAYLYRDWVIKAFNDDLRYDEFVKAQLAGDLIPSTLREPQGRPEPGRGTTGSGQAGNLRVKRELEGGWFQWVAMPLPAVLTIQSGINQLRYATLKGIMAAKKKEIRKAPPSLAAGASAGKQRIVSLYVPEKGKKTQIIQGSPAEAAKELVRKLREEARVIA